MLNMNAQVQPTIEQTRLALCQQLIGAGVTSPEAIVDTAKAIESFVYNNAEPYFPEQKVSSDVSEKAAVEKVEAIAQETAQTNEAETVAEVETKTTEQPSIEIADIKSALMRVAKADRNAFQAIMAKFNVTAVVQISTDDFPAVIAEVEKFEAQNA